MAERFKLILDEQDHHGSEIMGRFKAKLLAKDLYKQPVTLLGESKGPLEGDITYSFIRKVTNKEEAVG